MVESKIRWEKAKAFIIKHYLPLAFAVAIIWAMAWPAPGKEVASVVILDNVHLIQEINMIIVFFISGIVLKTEDIKSAFKYKLGVLYGFVSILLVTPCLGFAIREIPLTPPEYATGLTLLSAVPTTLGIGVSLVRTCKGNEGLALLLTVATNMLGVVTIPVWPKALFHGNDENGIGITVDMLDLFLRLLITILVPSVAGKVLREVAPPVKRFANKYKTVLSLTATTMLAMIIWQSLSGAQNTIVNTEFVNTLYIILLAIAQHILYLILNFIVVGYALRMPLPEAIATGIMSSQKSAPVAVTVIANLDATLSQQGLLAVPCIVSQIFQIFIGSFLSHYLGKKMEVYNANSLAAENELSKSASVVDTIVSEKSVADSHLEDVEALKTN